MNTNNCSSCALSIGIVLNWVVTADWQFLSVIADLSRRLPVQLRIASQPLRDTGGKILSGNTIARHGKAAPWLSSVQVGIFVNTMPQRQAGTFRGRIPTMTFKKKLVGKYMVDGRRQCLTTVTHCSPLPASFSHK